MMIYSANKFDRKNTMNHRLSIIITLIAAVILGGSGCGSKPVRKPGGPNSYSSRGKATTERAQLVAALGATLGSWDESHSDEEQRKLALNQLNAWSEAAESGESATAFAKSVGWEPDSTVAALPTSLRGMVDLERLRFDLQDVDFLREATWFHFLTNRLAAKPGALDPEIVKLPRHVQLAARIFEWTMLNVALDHPSWDRTANPWQVPETAVEMLHTPYVTLYTGRGTALARGWLFLSLARQAGLHGVLLAVTSNSEGKPIDEPRPWLPAILVEGEWYLFDSQWGIPLPGPNGRGIATLKQLREDPALLRQLDSDGNDYPITAEQLAGVTGLLELAPPSLTLRMRQLQFDLPDRVLAFGTREQPSPSELLKKYEAAGLSKPGLWKHPWQVAYARSPASSGMDEAIRTLRRQIAPFDVQLPTEKVEELKAVRPNEVSSHEQQFLRKDVATGRFYLIKKDEMELVEIPADLDPELYQIDRTTGEVFNKSGEPQNLVVDFRLNQVFRKYLPNAENRPKSVLELNRPVELDGRSGEIIRFDPELSAKVPLAKTLRHGRLMQVRGAWLRRVQVSSDGRREQTSGVVEVPEDLQGAIYWLLLSKAADGSYGTLISSYVVPNDLNSFLSLLKDANVAERDIDELRELFLAANLLPPQVNLLERMFSAQGIEASKVSEAASKLVELKNPVELYKYLEPLAKPLNLDKQAVQNLAQSIVTGNRVSGDTSPLVAKVAFLRLLKDINRRATLWLGQIQAEQGEDESAERYFKQYNQVGYRRWYSAAQLNLAALYTQQGLAAAEKDPEAAIKAWEQAIAIYKADESPQKAGSLWRANQLQQRISAIGDKK
jgi:hypothetical protein